MPPSNRYKRQIILPEIGKDGQEKISKASILCIGAGGLGCPALLYLAAAGIGHIGIIDFDNVDETNLQRQVLFTTDQIGQNKAEAAKARLRALNPDIEIQAFSEELTDKNAVTLFKNYDVILDGTDNFATKFLINDAAIKAGKPFIYASILGFEGQLSVFNLPHKGAPPPCYRCLFPEAPQTHIPNCAEAGIIGAVAGMIGSAQALEAIKIIVAHKELISLAGKLWTLDLRTLENRLLHLPKNPNCTLCSKEKEDIILTYSSPPCGTIPEITPRQTLENKTALLIDVREQEEWDTGHIENACHMPLSSLMQGREPPFDADREVILYCQKGLRSQKAAQILRAQGYLNISNMAGGYDLWTTEHCESNQPSPT